MNSSHNHRNEKKQLPVTAFGLFLIALWCYPTMAQDQRAVDDGHLDEIIVTGSRIARRDLSAPSPVVTLDSAEIQLAGTTTVEDILNTLPQVIADRDRTTNSDGGTAAINLRGMGIGRTLVMLNGRRFSASQIGGGVDINNIPAALIDRVEVVTGGASAVYGSDAVVGVVNFVIDDAFDGVEINAQYDVTYENDGQVFDLSISAGAPFAGGRGHVSGFLNYYDRQSLLGGDREFTSVVIGEHDGELVEVGSFAVPEGAILFPRAIIGGVPINGVLFNRDGTLRPANFPEDAYNFAPYNYLQAPLERAVAAAFLQYDFNASLRGEFEMLYAHNEIAQQFAPTPIGFFDAVNIDNPFFPPETQQILSDSFDPDGDGLAEFLLRRRLQEIEPRRLEDTRDVIRLLAGLDGSLTDTWKWQAYYSYTETDVDPLLLNAVSASRFEQALLIDPSTGGCLEPANGCIPANIYGAGNLSPEAAEFVRIGILENQEIIEEQIASVVFSGDLWNLPAGALGFAGGLEWRRIEAVFVPDPATLTGDIVGFRGEQPAIGATEVSEIFAEVLVPLLADQPLAEYLAVEAGARSSNYSTAGTVETWKVGAEWMPIESLRFRAMYQQAIRAPSVLEIFEVPRVDIRDRFNPVTDLCSASRDPVGNGLTDVCIAQGLDPALVGVFEAPDPNFVTFFTGGNPDLKPEESQSITLGFVLQPARIAGLSISLDYFDIEIADAIGDIEAGALAACFALKDPNSNLCSGYIRDASGRIAEASNYPRNVAVQSSEGIDLQLRYAIDALPLTFLGHSASFDLAVDGTWYMENGSQADPLTPFFDCAGYFGSTCAFSSFGTLPEFKTTTRLTYASGPLMASLRWRWIDGIRNSEPIFAALFNLPDPVLAIPEIGSKSYFDLSGTYEFSDSVTVYGGVNNLFDTGPPMLGEAQTNHNTDPSTYDAIGRQYFLGLNYHK